MLPEDQDCTGCGLTVDIQGFMKVPANGGNYTLSGVVINGLMMPSGSDTGLTAPAPGPSGSRWTIYDPDAEQGIDFNQLTITANDGECKKVDEDCQQDKPCKVVRIVMPVPKSMLSNGDLAFRINGGAVQLAGEETFTLNGVDQFSQFSLPISTDMNCGGPNLVVEIEFAPNNSTLPLPAGYSNWATGMKITFHCARCVGTEDPI